MRKTKLSAEIANGRLAGCLSGLTSGGMNDLTFEVRGWKYMMNFLLMVQN